jgi:hypothetical protein
MKIGDKLEGERQAQQWLAVNGRVPGIINMEFVCDDHGDTFDWWYSCTINKTENITTVASPIYWSLAAIDFEDQCERYHQALYHITRELRELGFGAYGYDAWTMSTV